jgi:hypothetical protein
MSYVPKHLELLDNAGTVDGWPKFVTPEAKAFCLSMLREGFHTYGTMSLSLAAECIFHDAAKTGEKRPECLKLALWDAIYAVTYRALLAADGEQVWRPKAEFADPDTVVVKATVS